MSNLKTANLDSTPGNQYYPPMKQQQTHFGQNSEPSQTQHWYESRGPIGPGKIPGPLGNPHLIRPPKQKTPRSEDNRFQSAQRYMKGLYDNKLSTGGEFHAYASPNWIGASVHPGPRGNPGSYGRQTADWHNREMPAVERPNPNGALSQLYKNQERAFNSLADDRAAQIDRAFTARIYAQGFQEAPAPHERY